jgi:hypothetical protein
MSLGLGLEMTDDRRSGGDRQIVVCREMPLYAANICVEDTE